MHNAVNMIEEALVVEHLLNGRADIVRIKVGVPSGEITSQSPHSRKKIWQINLVICLFKTII